MFNYDITTLLIVCVVVFGIGYILGQEHPVKRYEPQIKNAVRRIRRKPIVAEPVVYTVTEEELEALVAEHRESAIEIYLGGIRDGMALNRVDGGFRVDVEKRAVVTRYAGRNIVVFNINTETYRLEDVDGKVFEPSEVKKVKVEKQQQQNQQPKQQKQQKRQQFDGYPAPTDDDYPYYQ